MDIRRVILSQYLSALAMLKQAIVKFPRALWNDPKDKDGVWFKAYHALYYAHLYLQPRREDHVPWKGHGKPVSSRTLAKDEVLEYLAFVEQEVLGRVPVVDLMADSGFREIRVDKLELQFVNIRHIQHHVGELYERLGSRRSVRLDWAERRHRRRRDTRQAA
jgi:hypothetical protein